MVSLSRICLRCYSYNHGKDEPCKNPIVVSCSKCYRLNYLTKNCCDLPTMDDNRYMKCFHLAGNPTPRFFIDVKIHGRSISAMINTNISISKVDTAVLLYLQTERPEEYKQAHGVIEVPMFINNKTKLIKCEVGRLKDDI